MWYSWSEVDDAGAESVETLAELPSVVNPKSVRGILTLRANAILLRPQLQ